jgi:hypothetical protein
MTNVDWHHNYFASGQARNPAFKVGSGRVINNVVYNWRDADAFNIRGGGRADIIGNVYKDTGPASFITSSPIVVWGYTGRWRSTAPPPSGPRSSRGSTTRPAGSRAPTSCALATAPSGSSCRRRPTPASSRRRAWPPSTRSSSTPSSSRCGREVDEIADERARRQELDRLGPEILRRNEAVLYSGVIGQTYPMSRQIGDRWCDELGWTVEQLSACAAPAARRAADPRARRGEGSGA